MSDPGTQSINKDGLDEILVAHAITLEISSIQHSINMISRKLAENTVTNVMDAIVRRDENIINTRATQTRYIQIPTFSVSNDRLAY